jgi:hypothetical protein
MVISALANHNFRVFALILLTTGSVSFSEARQETLVPHQVMDTNGSGGLALTYGLPQGWRAMDRIYWNLGLRMNPMSFAMTIASEDQQELISYISALSFDFASNGYAVAGKPMPAHPSDFLMDDFRSVHPNAAFQVLDRQDDPIPFPYKPAVPNVTTRACHASLTIGFVANGVQSVERLSYDLYGYSQPTGRGSYRGNWIADGVTVVVSPTDEQDDAAQLARQVLASAKMDPAFLAKYKKVSAMLLEKTKAEGRAAAKRRAQALVAARSRPPSGGRGYSGGRAMDKDTFILHEAIRGLRCRIFNYAIGN